METNKRNVQDVIGDTLGKSDSKALFEKQVRQAVSGYNLISKTIHRESGYITKSGLISKHLVRTMNNWFKTNNQFYPTLAVVWNRTYDMLQFTERK